MSAVGRIWRAVAIGAALLGASALMAPAAQADFGFLPGEAGFKATATADAGGAPSTLAGSHPYSLLTEINLNQAGGFSEGDLKDLSYDLPPGLIENATAVPRCGTAQFTTPRTSPFEESLSGESCPPLSQIGIVTIQSSHAGGETRSFGVFNLAPPQGSPSRLGFSPYGEQVTIAPHVREAGSEYGLTLDLRNLSQQLDLAGVRLEIWGVPWASSHDAQRGDCLDEVDPTVGNGTCPVSALDPPHLTEAYLTLPSACEAPLGFKVSATSWQQPTTPVERSWTSGEALTRCQELPFDPVPSGRLSTNRTSSPSGYEFTLDGSSAALLNPASRASSQAKKAIVRLPEGMTVNPSVASGLGTCSEAQFAAETLASGPGAGCPEDSKVGELTIESPLIEGQIEGSMFFATPRANRFGTLLALYMVASDPDRGILVKVAGRVDSDPATGRLVATFDDLPQLPYSHFEVHFREGQRSPLATPASCGTYATEVETSPWLDPGLVLHQSSPFTLAAGVGGGPCPVGPPPFVPRTSGGTANANASSYSPFSLRLTRADGEQEITSYSATLPPGLLGNIGGVPFCPEAAIAAAKLQSGAESALAPACPAASLIGHTVTGYGVGQTLAYAPGTLYLAGPYHGQPLSVVAIDSAKVGPFDLGTVVIRSAIRVDRRNARVAIDSAGSDPIPHILDGFPLRLREIQIAIDRPHFMVNPTDCDPFALASTLTGSGGRFDDPTDDSSARSSVPFQVSNCSALDFAPRLALRLKGSHRRGRYPALQATVTPREGDANIGAATVTLPPKLFLAQEHLESVCTPRQFAAHSCPKDSIYGHATAVTPLLEEPLSGPVYLRSNGGERRLPDLVAAISGRGVEIELLGKIDSYKGGLRARFDELPDAPLTKFTMALRGGDHSLIVNAIDLCAHPQVATAKFTAQDEANKKLRVPCRFSAGRRSTPPRSRRPRRGGDNEKRIAPNIDRRVALPAGAARPCGAGPGRDGPQGRSPGRLRRQAGTEFAAALESGSGHGLGLGQDQLYRRRSAPGDAPDPDRDQPPRAHRPGRPAGLPPGTDPAGHHRRCTVGLSALVGRRRTFPRQRLRPPALPGRRQDLCLQRRTRRQAGDPGPRLRHRAGPGLLHPGLRHLQVQGHLWHDPEGDAAADRAGLGLHHLYLSQARKELLGRRQEPLLHQRLLPGAAGLPRCGIPLCQDLGRLSGRPHGGHDADPELQGRGLRGRLPSSRIGALFATALLGLAFASGAQAEVVAKGGLLVKFSGGISPDALPRQRLAPISVGLAGAVRTFSGQGPPSLRRIEIAINRGGHLDVDGLPICSRDQIQPSSTSQAREICGSALVGEGSFDADVAFPEQSAFPSHGHVLAFNAVVGGRPAILAHVYGLQPASTSRIIVFHIRRTSGTYGAVLTALVPESLDQWGHLTHFSLDLHRTYTYRGRRRSYLSAACPAPPGFPGATFPFARAAISFADGRTLASTLTRHCRVRR